jgi:hypothetical protein
LTGGDRGEGELFQFIYVVHYNMSYFISETWLRKKAAEFGKVISPHQIAALMHIYFGTLTLNEIAEKAGLSLDKLYSLRREPRFMFLVDILKKEYSKEFREDLLLNDYLPEEYDILAVDFTILDEMVQMQIKGTLICSTQKPVDEPEKSDDFRLATE